MRAWPWLLPALVLAVLCASTIRLGYFWDDFFFLTLKGKGDPLLFLIPNSEEPLYRPISQYLYFLFLRLVGDPTGLVGHLANLTILVLSVGLLVSLVSELRGRTAGLMAGLVFATFGCIPSLVAWISCDQDLLAIAFLLAAFLLRHRRKDLAAFACAAGALLSKEPALAAFPVLIYWDHLVGRRPTRTSFHLALYGGLALVWVLVHPGLRKLVLRGFQFGATGYVGMTPLESGGDHLFRYLLTLMNLPATGISTRWPAELTWAGIIALALIASGLWISQRSRIPEGAGKRVSANRVIWIGLLIAVPTILLPAFLVRHWTTYYASISAIGVATSLGTALAKMRPPFRTAFFLVFVPLGIWCRGIDYGEQVAWTEQSFRTASRATREVEASFKRLHPTLPSRAQILVSATATGIRGIGGILLKGQALRIWYRDPTLVTRRPELYEKGSSADYLVRITSRAAVVAIDADSLRVRWSGSGTPNPFEINRPIRGYARGLAAAGQWDRAVTMLEGLARIEQGMERAYDLRLIAMIRLAEGESAEAQRILDSAAPFSRPVALEIVKKLYTEASSSSALDSSAFQAFGLSTADSEAARYLMRRFWIEGWIPEAVHFARRLDALKPGDPESIYVLDRSKGLPDRPL